MEKEYEYSPGWLKTCSISSESLRLRFGNQCSKERTDTERESNYLPEDMEIGNTIQNRKCWKRTDDAGYLFIFCWRTDVVLCSIFRLACVVLEFVEQWCLDRNEFSVPIENCRAFALPNPRLRGGIWGARSTESAMNFMIILELKFCYNSN